MTFDVQLPGLSIRFAQREDAATLLNFTRGLARDQNQLESVRGTASDLEKHMFDRGGAEALIAEVEGAPIGMAFFCMSFNTYLSRPSIYLADLYVEPQARGRGYAHGLMSALAQVALERECCRLEWWCFEWNTGAEAFYRRLESAKPEGLRVQLLDGVKLEALAHRIP